MFFYLRDLEANLDFSELGPVSLLHFIGYPWLVVSHSAKLSVARTTTLIYVIRLVSFSFSDIFCKSLLWESLLMEISLIRSFMRLISGY